MQEHEDKIKAEAVSAYPLPVPNNIMHASYQLLSPWTTLQKVKITREQVMSKSHNLRKIEELLLVVTSISGFDRGSAGSASNSRCQKRSGICWENITQCMTSNLNSTEPQFDRSSASFNLTEFLCCNLILQSVRNEKECFCNINTFISQDPSSAPNVILVLGACGVADSVASVNALCQDFQAPSPTSALPMPRTLQFPPTSDASSLTPTTPVGATSPPSQTRPPVSEPPPSKGLQVILPAIVAPLAALTVLVVIGLYICKRKRKTEPNVANNTQNVNENVLTGDVALLTQPPVQVQVTNLADNPEKGTVYFHSAYFSFSCKTKR
ncbi:hypothetical protein SOVF_070140 isoform A [Spinacia oleracea]|nr:hypothetical protein SOVF_070140 isoform A [Spinacia oleracea]